VCTVWRQAVTLQIGRILKRKLTYYWKVFEEFWAEEEQDGQIRDILEGQWAMWLF
jgi:hypothetical protein